MHVQMHPSSGNVGKVGIMAEYFVNGIAADQLRDVTWRKSKRSGAVGNCVEIAELSSGEIAMRNSRFPSGPALVYTQSEIAAFVAGAKDGEFDDVVS